MARKWTISIAAIAAALVVGVIAWMPWDSSAPRLTFHDLLESSQHVGDYQVGNPHVFPVFVASIWVIPAPSGFSGSELVPVFVEGHMQRQHGWVKRSNGEYVQLPNVRARNHLCFLTGTTFASLVGPTANALPKMLQVNFRRHWPKNGRAMWDVIGSCTAIRPLLR